MPSWSGFWNFVYNDGHALVDSRAFRRRLRIAMKNYHIAYNRVISGEVQGVGNYTGDYERVAAQNIDDPFGTLGGKRGIETKVVINRAPVPADELMIRDDLYNVIRPNYVLGADKSGNGSGGMASTRGL